METGKWPNHSLLNICSFLSLKDTLFSLAPASPTLSQQITSMLAIFLRLHIANGDSSLLSVSVQQLKSVLTEVPRLLKVKPLFYNGGLSTLEIETSFEAMWEYSGTVYSSFYTRTPGQLLTNRLCAGYFAGVEGENLMTKRFHYDVNLFVNHRDLIDEITHEVLKRHLQTALTLDFLFGKPVNEGGEDLQEMLMDDDTWESRIDEQQEMKTTDSLEKTYSYESESRGVTVVREVAIARPLNFTGAVKTMMIFAGRRPGNEYSPDIFKKWEDIDTVEKAAGLERSTPIRTSDGVQYIEYEPGPGDYYPLMWVYFPDCTHNRTRIKLSRPHTFKQTTVMMYTIEDTRERFHLSDTQPNFDIMFVVFLGSIANLPEVPTQD